MTYSQDEAVCLMDAKIYDPLNKVNSDGSVADAMLSDPILPLGGLELFNGANIYVIYYMGDFEAYTPLPAKNKDGEFNTPIYMGKAVPPGARKGNFGLDSEPGPSLYKKLQEHAESITTAENLHMEDFFCRFLVIDGIRIPLEEPLLTAKFSSVWNKFIDGFGGHDSGKGRYEGAQPKWGTLYPRRNWANKCAARAESAEQITQEIQAYFRDIA